MPKRPRGKKSSRPPPARRPRKVPAPAPAPAPRQLLYKVVELSTVDEHHLERTINAWVPKGWTLDGVQFAMRESSKRPSMAFVFFTREGPAIDATADGEGDAADAAATDAAGAREHLHRLAGVASVPTGGGMIAPVPSVARPEPSQREESVHALHPYREFDPEHFERAARDAPQTGELDARTWPDRPERATDPWARLQALANDDDEDDGGPDL